MPDLPTLTRPWEIFLVHHSHVDIGYTEPQPIVLRRHADFVAQALDLCAATDHLPPGERYVWTCEVAWTVKAFLDRYPQRADELLRRIREGRVELTALYLQLTDLFTERLLERALDFAAGLAAEHHLPLAVAMNDDVNGWAWGLPRLLATRGVRYLDTAINETRALVVRPRPRPFWWASPDGSRVLLWHGDGYLQGNAYLGTPDGERHLFQHLANLEQSGYPHHALEVRIQGESHDNAPPGPWIPEAVAAWNRAHDCPQLHLGTAQAWFEHVERHWPEPIPELRLAWPDWWADGNGTTAYECGLARAAQADLATAELLEGLGAPLDAMRYREATEAALFFCEHTWGSFHSPDDPDALESRAGIAHKVNYAYIARVEARQLVRDGLAALAPRSDGPAIAVFNPSGWPRTDLVEAVVLDRLVTDHPDAWVPAPARTEPGPPLHLVEQGTGRQVAAELAPVIANSARQPGQRVRFVARDVPPQGWRLYHLRPGPAPLATACLAAGLDLHGPHYQAQADPRRGGLASLVHGATGRELVRPGEYALNQWVYETVAGPGDREAIAAWTGIRRDADLDRLTPPVVIIPGPPLPYGASLLAEGGGGDLPVVRTEIVVYDDLPRLDLANVLHKRPHPEAEAVYQAFPLAGDPPTVWLDLPGAVMRPGLDQVPGTATDWHSVQHYFAVAGPEGFTVVATPDIGLVQVNGINTGRWQETLPPHTGLVMSWVLNNYWFTNFPATQAGAIPYRYSLAWFPGEFDPLVAGRFAAEIRQPLEGMVVE